MADGSGTVTRMTSLDINKLTEYARFGWQIEQLIDLYKAKRNLQDAKGESIALVIDLHKRQPGAGTAESSGECCIEAMAVVDWNQNTESLMEGTSAEAVGALTSGLDFGGPILLGCQPCGNVE